MWWCGGYGATTCSGEGGGAPPLCAVSARGRRQRVRLGAGRGRLAGGRHGPVPEAAAIGVGELRRPDRAAVGRGRERPALEVLGSARGGLRCGRERRPGPALATVVRSGGGALGRRRALSRGGHDVATAVPRRERRRPESRGALVRVVVAERAARGLALRGFGEPAADQLGRGAPDRSRLPAAGAAVRLGDQVVRVGGRGRWCAAEQRRLTSGGNGTAREPEASPPPAAEASRAATAQAQAARGRAAPRARQRVPGTAR